jgi:hypothetical protein
VVLAGGYADIAWWAPNACPVVGNTIELGSQGVLTVKSPTTTKITNLAMWVTCFTLYTKDVVRLTQGQWLEMSDYLLFIVRLAATQTDFARILYIDTQLRAKSAMTGRPPHTVDALEMIVISNEVSGVRGKGGAGGETGGRSTGTCHAFNSAVGCTKGKSCRFTHTCSACRGTGHGATSSECKEKRK